MIKAEYFFYETVVTVYYKNFSSQIETERFVFEKKPDYLTMVRQNSVRRTYDAISETNKALKS